MSLLLLVVLSNFSMNHFSNNSSSVSTTTTDTITISNKLVNIGQYLGVVISYFSDKDTIVSTFLGLVELDGGSIARAVVVFLEKSALKKRNWI